MLIGEEKWQKLNADGHTLVTLFTDALKPEGEAAEFDLDATLQKRRSPVADVTHVDLLPSSLDLIDVQDRLATMPTGRFSPTTRPTCCGGRSGRSSTTTTTCWSTARRTSASSP